MAIYATADEAGGFIRIEDDEENVYLNNMLGSASRVVDAHCGWTFDSPTGTETARVFAAVRDRHLLYVDPIANTTNLVVKTDTSGNGTYDLTWSSTDYQMEPLNQRQGGLTDHPYYKIRAVGTRDFPLSREALVQVTADWGWTSGVPDTIRDATILLAKYLHEERQTVSGFAFSDGDAVFTSGKMSPRIKMMLAPYRRVYL